MEEIKKELRSFAEFYGGDCWQNGRQGIRELPNGDEFINIYADKIAKILSKHIVSGRSELLFAYSKALTPNADDKLIREFIDEYLKANNSH